MKKQAFEAQNEPRWRELETVLEAVDKKKQSTDAVHLPGMFRQVCADLALAQHRMYGRRLCARLNGLVVRSYQHLNHNAGLGVAGFWKFFRVTFPATIRQEWKLLLLNNILFWLPAMLLLYSGFTDASWAMAANSPEQLEQIDEMYGSESPAEFMRKEAGSDFMMFCFYIWNNIGIDLKTFGAGVLGGIGSGFVVVFNGLNLGSVFGYLHYTGNAHKLYNFAISHSSFELIGMMVCGMGGMVLGSALLFPGRLSRGAALKAASKRAKTLLFGGVTLTFLAAIVEGFWSASSVPLESKYAFGIVFWVLIPAYFFFSGRKEAGADA